MAYSNPKQAQRTTMGHANKKATLLSTSIFLILLCILVIVGIYTFINAKGASYLSNDSAACNNCHVMNDVYFDYTNGVHAKKVKGEPRATCSDCHLPHSFVSKWIAKAESGIGHAYAFTFKLNDLPTNFNATEKSKKMIQANCIRCHSDVASVVINPTTIPGHTDKTLQCASCHQHVGH